MHFHLFFLALPNTTITKTYYLSDAFKADWAGAYTFCRVNGLQLVTLDTLDEMTQFLQFCNNYIPLQSIYIGGVSASLGDKKNWVWFQTGTKVNYTLPWLASAPSGENCLGVAVSKKKYNVYDLACNGYQYTFLNFVCQDTTWKGKGYRPGKLF